MDGNIKGWLAGQMEGYPDLDFGIGLRDGRDGKRKFLHLFFSLKNLIGGGHWFGAYGVLPGLGRGFLFSFIVLGLIIYT